MANPTITHTKKVIRMLDYQDFLRKLDQYGMLWLGSESRVPSISMWADPAQWHTDKEDTDPWQFRIRFPREGRGLYGCHFGGKKGFVSLRNTAVFLAACQPEDGIESLYRAGLLDAVTYQVYLLFSRRRVLSTSQLRQEMGNGRKGNHAVDRAVERLQSLGLVTIIDNVRKTKQKGEAYGWPINLYQCIEDRLEALGLEESPLTRREAQAACLDQLAAAGGLDMALAVAQGLGWNPGKALPV